MVTGSEVVAHRGNYLLERGVWRAVCRACGWTVSDGNRRRAAAMFRLHLQDAAEHKARAGVVIVATPERAGPVGAAPVPKPAV